MPMLLGEEATENYMRQKITYAAEPGDRVPAYLLMRDLGLVSSDEPATRRRGALRRLPGVPAALYQCGSEGCAGHCS